MTRPDLKIVSSIQEPRPADPHRKGDVRYSDAATGHRIRAVRITRGITEGAAAAACKVSLKTYRRWEAGGAIRSWYGQMKRLAELFDAHPCWISLGSGDPPANPTDGRIAFMLAKPSRRKTSPPATAYHALTEKELLEQYKALLQEQRMYISGAIAALTSLNGGGSPAA
jgi:transcriptional regulator with XRE-family HTH domain